MSRMSFSSPVLTSIAQAGLLATCAAKGYRTYYLLALIVTSDVLLPDLWSRTPKHTSSDMLLHVLPFITPMRNAYYVEYTFC